MYFLYILRSKKNGSYYTGMTNDIDERLNRHNQGWVKATKYLVPWNCYISNSIPDLLRQGKEKSTSRHRRAESSSKG